MKISIIIPTFNRSEDLKKTLDSIIPFKKEFEEIIIVDQSKDLKTKIMILKLKNKKIKYVFSKIPSITVARNLGFFVSKKSSELICFLDDDVTIKKNFFKEIKKNFLKEGVMGVAAFIENKEKKNNFFEFIKSFFFLSSNFYKNADIVSPYGNNYPSTLRNEIHSGWFPGVNMTYKRNVLEIQKFDENLLGYTIAEDIDFTYRLNQLFPKSLIITPKAKIIHRASLIERLPTKKMSYINQIDHFYFFLKNMNFGYKNKFIFLWSLVGISILRIINFLIKPNKINYLKLKYYFISLLYCFKNIKKIKMGRLREFNV